MARSLVKYLQVVIMGMVTAAASVTANAGDLPELGIFKKGNVAPYSLYLGSPTNWHDLIPESGTLSQGVVRVEPSQINEPNDARKVTWTSTGQIYAQSNSTIDRLDYLDAESALVFDIIVHEPPQSTVAIRVDCKYPCIGIVDATKTIKSLPVGEKTTVKIPLSCFANTGTDFGSVNTPMVVYTTSRFSASFANIRWTPGAGKDADVMNCKKGKS